MKSGVVTLRSIELAGFKSFAKRTKIEFGNGLVAIVGPNGSGKSNIADAIRWVFGEQKNKSLRSDKSEDLIYHGGNGKARASMAEVVITLDNSTGKIPMDIRDIEITRRLYRSGESNYLLNGKKVSLASIREILAGSGFGIGSYTVIGQGMIERLILSDGIERKKLFEEASGIKQFEIKISQTKKRLDQTTHNLKQINDLIAELRPQLNALERQSALLEKRRDVMQSLASLKLAYINQNSETISDQIAEIKSSLSKYELELKSTEQDLAKLELEHNNSSGSSGLGDASAINDDLSRLEALAKELDAKISNTSSLLQENSTKSQELAMAKSRINSEISVCQSTIANHAKAHQALEKSVSRYDSKISLIDEKIQDQTKLLDATKKELNKTQKTEYLKHSLGLIDILQDSIARGRSSQELRIIFYKLRRSIKHSINDNSAELALKVGRIQNTIAGLLDEKEKQTELQTTEIIKLRASEMDTSTIYAKITQLEKEQKSLAGKLSDDGLLAKQKYLQKQLIVLEKDKNKLSIKIDHQRNKLVEIASQGQSEENSGYFASHEKLTNQKVSLSHYIENKLEDLRKLESELSGLVNLKKSWFPSGPKNIKPHLGLVELSQIDSLSAQLSLLQEINPDVQKGADEAMNRMRFLESQSKDLTLAITDLQKLSDSTTQKMQTAFKKGFNQINKNFSESFVGLFDGGTAELSLVDSPEGFGIDIKVQLPNKQLQPISSLSGGEKALASVALLSAILSSNPSPFIVLDEVDAALDESNTKKFADVIAQITKHSQVLVVTHNHETMSAASELLGVTTSGNNDSHIIRVRLDSLPAGSLTN